MDQKLNETSILTYTLVNKNETVYNLKNGAETQKPKTVTNHLMVDPLKDSILKSQNPNGSLLVPTPKKGAKDRHVIFSNKSTDVNVFQKKETYSKCECLCFHWLFSKKSKDVLLEGNSNNETDNDVRTSGI